VRDLRSAILAAALLAAACGGGTTGPPAAHPRPSILLVTLDTTRADAIGPEARGVTTPAFDALAARGRRYRRAWATVPETLPAHASLLTGLYPAGHGVHENARPLAEVHPLLAERLRGAGYATAAFVSAFVLDRRFGLARGFDQYDDAMPAGQGERSARDTTERALTHLSQAPAGPLFLWVHYYDPHAPYEPPEPFRSRYPEQPYLGEVAAMDAELGRLVAAFEARPGTHAVVVVGDHGEGMGEHGERGHGKLLYGEAMRVPLLVAGPGFEPGVRDAPVSARRVFDTVLDLAGLEAPHSLRGTDDEVVLAEAMKPFLSYGWQPQTMAVGANRKAILAGLIEVYDLAADPGESRPLAAAEAPRPLRDALRTYPVPAPGDAPAGEGLDAEARRQLASLGYVSAGARPAVRPDAPRPADMTALFDVIDRASALFVAGQWERVIPLLQRILADDPGNLDAALRLATAHSSLGHEEQARAAFERAAAIAPGSVDVRTYLGLHYAKGPEWRRAVPLLEGVLAESPDRLPAIEALASVREREGRLGEAVTLRRRAYSLREASAEEELRLGELAMAAQQTEAAIEAFEAARRRQGARFDHDLELGVLYLAASRLEDARGALDRVLAARPRHPMALFKRAQVSVLLGEPDRAERVAAARRGADATTRPLVERERLFRGL